MPRSGRSPGGGSGNPVQSSCSEKPMDGGACGAAAHGVARSPTRLKRLAAHTWAWTSVSKDSSVWPPLWPSARLTLYALQALCLATRALPALYCRPLCTESPLPGTYPSLPFPSISSDVTCLESLPWGRCGTLFQMHLASCPCCYPVVSDSATPWTAAHRASLSTIFQNLLCSCPLSR